MLETIISGLVLAAVSGLAFLAYKHHEGYSLLIKWVRVVAFGVFACLLSFNLGFTCGKYSNGAAEPFSIGWVVIAFCVFQLYVGLLDFLPDLIGQHGKENKQKQPPPEQKSP